MSSHHHPLPHHVSKEQPAIPQASVRPLVRPLIMSPGRQQQQQQQLPTGGRPQMSPGIAVGGPPSNRPLMSPVGGGNVGRSLMSPGGGHDMLSPSSGGNGRPCHTAAGCRDPLSPDRSQMGSPEKERMPSKGKRKSVREGIYTTLLFFTFHR
jgi:hypothetical protein